MGRGDKKSKKGKQWRGSFGVSRNKNSIKARLKRASSQSRSAVSATAEAAPKVKRAPKKKAEA